MKDSKNTVSLYMWNQISKTNTRIQEFGSPLSTLQQRFAFSVRVC
jgi:hypothetical protein